jgi:hypothetical protein
MNTMPNQHRKSGELRVMQLAEKLSRSMESPSSVEKKSITSEIIGQETSARYEPVLFRRLQTDGNNLREVKYINY